VTPPNSIDKAKDEGSIPGTVLRGTGGVWHVHGPDGDTRPAALGGGVKHTSALKLAVGDDVMLRPGASDDLWSITEILPRRTRLVRRTPGNVHGERVVAANVDQVVVVFAMLKPEPHLGMLDRFLVIAEANDLAARIVVNKIDLAGDQAARERFGAYETVGYPVHYTSTKTAHGLPALHDALHRRTSALTGPSGVGKSSLINAMYPGLNLRVGAISESVNKGRHTTAGADMHPLPDGGYVVDTPGLREVGLWGVPSEALDGCFPEMRDRRVQCQFANCRHLTEPQCAIRSAVTSGEIAGNRYDSYRKLVEEARASEKR
jgi:ribosome biogenesis GTPase / thiamine phosphate phosphatase